MAPVERLLRWSRSRFRWWTGHGDLVAMGFDRPSRLLARFLLAATIASPGILEGQAESAEYLTVNFRLQ